MPSTSWRSRPGKILLVHGALLRFAFTRTVILRAQVRVVRVRLPESGEQRDRVTGHWFQDGGEAVEIPFEYARRGTTVAIWVAGPRPLNVDARVRLELEVEYEGEVPVLVGVDWVHASGVGGETESSGPFVPSWLESIEPEDRERVATEVVVPAQVEQSEVVAEELSADALLDRVTADESPSAVFNERERAIEVTSAAQRFFLAFDRDTTRETLGVVTLDTTHTSLARFASRRAKAADAEMRAAFDPGADLSSSLRIVSDVFEDSMRTARLPEENLPFAFELFIAGRLSIVHPEPSRRDQLKSHGAVNSWYYFLFAELALACARASGAYFPARIRARWARRVPFFVRTAHLLATFEWAQFVTGAAEQLPIAPFAYFDGYTMKFERVEGSRSSYAPLEEELANGAADADIAAWLAPWESRLALVLKLTSAPRESFPELFSGEGLSPLLPDKLPKLPEVGVLRIPTQAGPEFH